MIHSWMIFPVKPLFTGDFPWLCEITRWYNYGEVYPLSSLEPVKPALPSAFTAVNGERHVPHKEIPVMGYRYVNR